MDLENQPILKVEEVADFLRTQPIHVLRLLESGKIAGFKVAGEWRIASAALLEFLRSEMEATQQEVLQRNLSDPREWAKQLQRMPEYRAFLEEQEFDENTFGAFLKRGLRTLEQESGPHNVTPFRPQTVERQPPAGPTSDERDESGEEVLRALARKIITIRSPRHAKRSFLMKRQRTILAKAVEIAHQFILTKMIFENRL